MSSYGKVGEPSNHTIGEHTLTFEDWRKEFKFGRLYSDHEDIIEESYEEAILRQKRDMIKRAQGVHQKRNLSLEGLELPPTKWEKFIDNLFD